MAHRADGLNDIFEHDVIVRDKAICGTTPTAEADLTNKKYVDNSIDADITTHAALPNAHHNESHTIASHSDTTATGTELNTLTDDSVADALHRHSELVASDGSPDPVVSIDESGNVLISGSDNQTINSIVPAVQNSKAGGFANYRYNSSITQGAFIQMAKSNSGTIGSHTAVSDNELLGRLIWAGSDGTEFKVGARIDGYVDGTPTTGEIPTELRFLTLTDGESSVSRKMVLRNDGKLGINTISPDTKLQVVGDTKLGDDNTNYTEISETGDVVFVGGAGLAYGEIYYANGGSAITLAAQDTWYQITSFDTNGVSNNTTPDHTNDHITVTKAGDYKIDFHISGHSAQSNNYVIELKKNNGATGYSETRLYSTTAVAGQVDTYSGAGIISLDANDTVEVWIMRTDGGAVSKTFTVDAITLTLFQIGG